MTMTTLDAKTALSAGWSDLVPELDRQPEEHGVTKRTWGAFTGTDLDAHPGKLGVMQVVVAGVATSAGVEQAARHARERGVDVTPAIGAMTDRRPEARVNSIARVFPRLGETGTAREIIDMLDRTHA